jgi:rSAM/selenodomain-associated transferase 2
VNVSIIVPVLNEAPQIRPFLRHLRVRAPDAEVVVVDGGSNDGTPQLGTGLCDRLVETSRGRPHQMNTGARFTHGDVLWFVHADNEVPDESIDAITRAMGDPIISGGCFRVRIPQPEWIYRVHDGLAHYIGRLLNVRCGDHGIFVRRSVFERLGGYPDVPLMEEVKLFRAMQREGRIAWLPNRLLLSKRRHEQVGVYRYTLICSLVVLLFVAGVSPARLSQIYHHLVPTRHLTRRPLAPVEDELFSEFRAAEENLTRSC